MCTLDIKMCERLFVSRQFIGMEWKPQDSLICFIRTSHTIGDWPVLCNVVHSCCCGDEDFHLGNSSASDSLMMKCIHL